ncbi:hypothetical protein CARUB_v10028248mg [Capsella rubella]|uniref:Glutamyl/glutaminyl-tRNA synthetase class Ib anti-codon binding domain-containing protein n=1 Tax=Capsella rubella TaxID=81985 RepID=R0GDX3_9BRAS|nr:hypothetical protein CARUB_v10028248mg [Capsella rubella]
MDGMKLLFPPESPPLSVIIALCLSASPVTIDSSVARSHRRFLRLLRRHKKFEGAGEKASTFSKRIWMEEADPSVISIVEQVTLMDWGNTIVKEITKNLKGHVTTLSGVLNHQGSIKTTKLKLTWLPDTNELLEDDDEVADFVNPNTKKETCHLVIRI